MTNDLINDILRDMKVELEDEFDRNFSRGAFFDKRWKSRLDGEASHLQESGTLRKSIRTNIRGRSLVFSSSVPYASIHNEGGTITITRKMQRFFWAKYYENGGIKKTKTEVRANLSSTKRRSSTRQWHSKKWAVKLQYISDNTLTTNQAYATTSKILCEKT